MLLLGSVVSCKLRDVQNKPLADLLCRVFDCEQDKTELTPSGYRTWATTTGETLNYPIPGHEEHFRRIYINSIGEGVSVSQRNGKAYYTYPAGTIIVKDIFESLEPLPGAEPFQQTVMIKDPRNPKARGGWLWVVRDEKTAGETVIDYEFCVDCHSNANESHPYGDTNPNHEFRDFLFFPYQKR